MAVHKFECGFTCRCGNRIHWKGTWERVCIENELVTVRVTGRGAALILWSHRVSGETLSASLPTT